MTDDTKKWTLVLQQLLPRGIAWTKQFTLYDLLTCFASELERLETSKNTIIDEMFPKTVTQMIDEFEDTFRIVHTSESISIRRARLLAKINAVGGQSIDYYYGLAENAGYNRYPSVVDPHIRIFTGIYQPFRAGISMAGDAVYDGGSGASVFSWIVAGTTVESDTFLQELFNQYKPAHTEIQFVNS